jgi:CBS-domain-containing membrane protein
MGVKDVMTPNVICIGVDEPVLKAVRLMLQNRISGLPALDKEGELVGIVTEGRIKRIPVTRAGRVRSAAWSRCCICAYVIYGDAVRARPIPPSALIATTTSGGVCQTMRRTNPTSANAKSPGVITALVQIGL